MTGLRRLALVAASVLCSTLAAGSLAAAEAPAADPSVAAPSTGAAPADASAAAPATGATAADTSAAGAPTSTPAATDSRSAHGAAHQHHAAPFSRRVDAALLEKPIAIESGIGKVHQKVTTGSAEAQTYYDQGLAHLHAYQWIQAARSFHEALRRDPEIALARIGLARAYEGMKDESAADRELARAEALAPGASPREQRYVAAYAAKRRALTAPEAQREAAAAAYVKVLDELTAEDPADAEAWLLRGNAEEGPWGRGQAGGESALRFYEAALRASPDHFGAHHYIAHTYENVGREREAVRHAEVFARACPDVPHARHMFAHTLPRVGRWQEAVAELEAADAIEERAEREDGIPRGEDWHRVHNLNLLGLAYLRLGRAADAERTLREGFDTPIPDPLAQSWHSTWPEFLLVQGRPREAQAAARELAGRDSPMARVIGSALEGEALLDLGDTEGAGERARETGRRIEELRAAAAGHARAELLVWVATEYGEVLDARGALRGGLTPRWAAFIANLGNAIAENPTFDGWGVGWLRLKRLEKEARATGNADLADRLAQQLDDAAP